MGSFFRERVRENGLAPGAELAGGESGQAKTLMADHQAINDTSFRVDDVAPVDRHGSAVVVILERRRTGAHSLELGIVEEMPRRNAAKEGNVVGDSPIVGKVPGAVFRRAQNTNSARCDTPQPLLELFFAAGQRSFGRFAG